MNRLISGLIIGLIAGFLCCSCGIAKGFLKAEPMTNILSDRGFINTTTVVTKEGTYRIFTIENRNNSVGGIGITAIKIK